MRELALAEQTANSFEGLKIAISYFQHQKTYPSVLSVQFEIMYINLSYIGTFKIQYVFVSAFICIYSHIPAFIYKSIYM